MDDSDGPAFTITKFCAFYSISRPHYYKLKRLGLGPQECRVGTSILILHQSRKAWEARLLNASGGNEASGQG